MKDPKVYPEPDRFLPERYLASDGHEPQKDPRGYAFGFGRRFVPVPKLRHLRDTYTYSETYPCFTAELVQVRFLHLLSLAWMFII